MRPAGVRSAVQRRRENAMKKKKKKKKKKKAAALKQRPHPPRADPTKLLKV
jgi:hypothetical protein